MRDAFPRHRLLATTITATLATMISWLISWPSSPAFAQGSQSQDEDSASREQEDLYNLDTSLGYSFDSGGSLFVAATHRRQVAVPEVGHEASADHGL